MKPLLDYIKSSLTKRPRIAWVKYEIWQRDHVLSNYYSFTETAQQHLMNFLKQPEVYVFSGTGIFPKELWDKTSQDPIYSVGTRGMGENYFYMLEHEEYLFTVRGTVDRSFNWVVFTTNKNLQI